MSKFKLFFKQTAIYGISTIMLRLVSWFVGPYLTHATSQNKVGENAYLFAGISLFNIIYMLGMETSFFRFSRDYPYGDVYKSCQTAVFTNSLIWSLVFIILATPISHWIECPQKEIYIYLITAILFFENICNIPFAKLRYENKPTLFMSLKALNILTNVFLTVFFISFLMKKDSFILSDEHFKDPTVWILIATLIPWVMTTLILSKDILKGIRFNDKKLFSNILSYSWPLIIVGMAGIVNETMDRIFLKHLLNGSLTHRMSQVGIYSANYKLAIIMTLAIQGFRMGAEPFFFRESKDKNASKNYAIIMDFFVIACCIIMVLTSINRELISRMNEASFSEGIRILPILLLANLFLGIYYNSTVWFKLTDSTGKGARIAIFGAIITIIFNLWLIPVLGYVGSALATLICYFSMMMVSLIWGQRVYPIPYAFGYLTAWVLGSTLYSTLVFYYFKHSMIALIGFSILFLAIASVLAYRRLLFSKKLLS